MEAKMQPHRSARNAEREFLDSCRGLGAALTTFTPLDRARQVQQAIDDARPLRIPVGQVLEVPVGDLTEFERTSLFGCFDDTQPMELVP